MSKPRTTSSLVVAVVAVLTTGCGGPDAQALLDGAGQALEDAGTSRFEMRVEGTGGGTFAADGAQDLRSGALRMAIDLGDAGPGTETLLLGDEVFVRSPLLALFTGDESTWVRVDLAETAAAEGLDTDALLGQQAGPAALLAQLDGATDDLEELGTEEVRGVSTNHLRVTVDTDAVIEQSDPAVRDQLRLYAEQSGLPPTYPMELWIDDDGLVRRIRTLVDVTDPTTGGDITQQTTLELFDFGVEVDLERPLEEQTLDLRELTAELEAFEQLEEGLGDAGDDPADDTG